MIRNRQFNKILIRLLAAVLAGVLALAATGCGKENAVESAEGTIYMNDAESAASDGIKIDSERRDEILQKEMDLSPLEEKIVLPQDSCSYSESLAEQALLLCTGHTKEKEAKLLEDNGFTVLLQNNYEKEDDDPAHSCAYTFAVKDVEYGGETRTLVVAAIRGTNAGEWYSNFDFAESHSDDTEYAENFLFAAEDVMVTLESTLQQMENPLVLICGHSRGAAAANILGMLENAVHGTANIFTYTFAAPATHKGEEYTDCSNIFNIINPCDVVPMVPLKSWGYERYGTDIILDGDAEEINQLEEDMESLYEIAPTISSYYEDRHSLTGAGLSEDGATTFELMMILASTLADSVSMYGEGESTASDEETETSFDIDDLLSMTEESDFAPLFELLKDMTDDDCCRGLDILENHMPYRYQELLNSK